MFWLFIENKKLKDVKMNDSSKIDMNKINSDYRWVEYFFKLCNVISEKSKDPSTKVGCIIANSGHSIVSTGYNGFPIGVKDDLMDFSECKIKKSKRYERPEKYFWTAHAEENAIALAARNGTSLNGTILYVNRMMPCTRCTRLIIQSGIKKVCVYVDAPAETIERWKEENDIAETMMDEAGVELVVLTKPDKK